jgi:hypothetical protein
MIIILDRISSLCFFKHSVFENGKYDFFGVVHRHRVFTI